MSCATKEDILGTKPPREAVSWNDKQVWIAAMSGTDRDAFEAENLGLAALDENTGHLSNIRARLLVKCLVDESGERLFVDQDAVELGKVWCAPLDKAFAVAKRINSLSQADMEELEKNSASAPS
jgi:hypothetical protein